MSLKYHLTGLSYLKSNDRLQRLYKAMLDKSKEKFKNIKRFQTSENKLKTTKCYETWITESSVQPQQENEIK